MKVTDIIARLLVEQGFRHVFAISGGASLHLIHSFAETPGLRVVCPQHEQAGAMAADAYSRLTAGHGCAVATSGPGATNLITGIAAAYYDSVPVLYLTGNVARYRDKSKTGVRQVGFQETEFVEMCRTITNYAVKVTDPRLVKREILKALHLSRSGRPGPVVVDLPDDLQFMDFDESLMESYEPEVQAAPKIDLSGTIGTVLEWMRVSERPVLVLGWGTHLAGAESETRLLADRLNIPVLMTWAAMDLLPHMHPMVVGGFGTHGTRYGNFTIQNSDLILSIGSRLDSKATGSPPTTFARGAKIIMVDIDLMEIQKFESLGRRIDLGLSVDARLFIRALLAALPETDTFRKAEWTSRVQEWKRRYPQQLPEYQRKGEVNPYWFVKCLADQLEEGDLIVSETGCALAWMMQAFEFKRDQRFLHAFNLTPMGWGLPAAIGAALANPGRRVICIAGDGSLQMNIQELITVTRHDLPIKIFLLNNHGHGMVQQTQEMWFGGKFHATSVEGGLAFPDFTRVAAAYNYPVNTIDLNEEIPQKIGQALQSSSFFFSNVEINSKYRVQPQVKFGRPNEDSMPLLDRQEFFDNMIVEPLPISRTLSP